MTRSCLNKQTYADIEEHCDYYIEKKIEKYQKAKKELVLVAKKMEENARNKTADRIVMDKETSDLFRTNLPIALLMLRIESKYCGEFVYGLSSICFRAHEKEKTKLRKRR